MAYGSLPAPGPQSWGFLCTGPTQQVALAASTSTVTLAQFVTSAPYATQALVQASGAAAVNSFAKLEFGTNVTLSATVGMPIVPLELQSQQGTTSGRRFGSALSTGHNSSPTNVCVLGSAGTVTVWLTPGIGNLN